jgi:hypothetical protein
MTFPPPAEPMDSRADDFGTVEVTLDSRLFWLWRCRDVAAFQDWSAIGYRTRQDAFDAAARKIRGVRAMATAP